MAKKSEFITGYYQGYENSIISAKEFGKRSGVDENGNSVYTLPYWERIKDLSTKRQAKGKFKFNGRYGEQFILENVDTGEKFSLFGGDLLSLLDNLTFDITLEPCKRGQKIAFRRVK